MSDPEVADRGSSPIPTRMVMSTEVNMKYRLQFATELYKDGGIRRTFVPSKQLRPTTPPTRPTKKLFTTKDPKQ